MTSRKQKFHVFYKKVFLNARNLFEVYQGALLELFETLFQFFKTVTENCPFSIIWTAGLLGMEEKHHSSEQNTTL